MNGLPKWVWDILADLIEEEDVHPKLYFTSGATEGLPYDWCPKLVLEKVPSDVLKAAEVVREYRRSGASE